MSEFVVPIFLTIEAGSRKEAQGLVYDALTDDGFEWPLQVVCSCVGNEDEVIGENE